MLRDTLLHKALKPEMPVEADRSRCSRMRFDRSSCTRCTEQCRAGALSFREEVGVDTEACSGCMLCTASCPSGCFEADLDFFSVLGRLRKIPQPVLGCSGRPGLASHVKTPCLGFLTEEHMIATAVFLREPLQVNLAGCAGCENGFIAETVRAGRENIRRNLSPAVSSRIILVEDTAALDYREISYDRRGFFRALRNLTFLHASEVFESGNDGCGGEAYSVKKVPEKRDILNRALPLLPAEVRRKALEAYYYSLRLGENCTGCFACVGMCPSGALRVGTEGAVPVLEFKSSLCGGCGLCREFCMVSALQVERGFPGDDPFLFGKTVAHTA